MLNYNLLIDILLLKDLNYLTFYICGFIFKIIVFIYIMETLANAILPNSASKFYCDCCDYGTCKKSSYDDHILSAKHQKRANGNILETLGNAILLNSAQKICCEKCLKEFVK